MASEYYIGLMSGTSIDGMDAALCEVRQDGSFACLKTLSDEWPEHIKGRLHELCSAGPNELEKAGTAQNAVAAFSAVLVNRLLEMAGLDPAQITAIGSHGQTVRHRPEKGFSLQLDNAPMTALLTGIDVWSDFRAQDIAAGGQGAPLTPLFHAKCFARPERWAFVVNLGGIANMTVLAPGGKVELGFDCGPANTLMDLVCRELFNRPYDEDGYLAQGGITNASWLKAMLNEPYFLKQAPKSCGRELFGREFIAPYLDECLKTEADGERRRLGADLLHTLCDLTAALIAADIKEFMYTRGIKEGYDVILCGGGVYNAALVKSIRGMCEVCKMVGVPQHSVLLCSTLGIDPNFVEAQAFAYFAYLSSHGRLCDLKAVTGSEQPVLLGSFSPAPEGRFVRSCSAAAAARAAAAPEA